MAFMEGFSSEKPVVLEHMLGHIPFHPRHLVPSDPIEHSQRDRCETGYENIYWLKVYFLFYISRELIM
jgi:hypothetical protein